ncbi:hypothetical protein CTI12_AA000380 [Artemisia annua]|uniref:Uncharacterized protein n=1 Tax=Artemisia annua TaxID=35608 RepID=A0A2U1QJN9_ARTAN|nr:hypothetical protein CTI12_AA000380 [Artemisia annua]
MDLGQTCPVTCVKPLTPKMIHSWADMYEIADGSKEDGTKPPVDKDYQYSNVGFMWLPGYGSDGNNKLMIREKLVGLVGDRDDDFSMRLGKKMKVPKLLTVAQKRNIKRRSYLNEVSQRNDTNFFATIGAFVLLPPIIILGIAIATVYLIDSLPVECNPNQFITCKHAETVTVHIKNRFRKLSSVKWFLASMIISAHFSKCQEERVYLFNIFLPLAANSNSNFVL